MAAGRKKKRKKGDRIGKQGGRKGESKVSGKNKNQDLSEETGQTARVDHKWQDFQIQKQPLVRQIFIISFLPNFSMNPFPNAEHNHRLLPPLPLTGGRRWPLGYDTVK